MNPKLLNTLSGLAACGALLILGLLCDGADARRSAREGSPLATIDAAIEAGAAEAEAPKRRARRARASLSMPYFSFAQSLRPRG